MANKLLAQMGLHHSIANIFAARNILTAKDALSLTEFELMELLDVGLEEVKSAVAQISEIACPPCQTALLLLENRLHSKDQVGYLSTSLKGLDNALCGGVPFGALTELVGPAGMGKTQFCLKLSILAALPCSHGGLNGRVVYIDTESKFSSRRLMEIGANSFPEVFSVAGKAQEMAGRIIVLQPASLAEFTESLQQIKLSLLQHQVKLLIIDSMAALDSVEYEKDKRVMGQHPLGWHVSFLKSLAEFSRIPIVVTNQVRAHGNDEAFHFPFEAKTRDQKMKHPERFDSLLTAALGIHWAHAVTIRLVLEAYSGQRFLKVAKSPISPPLVFPFEVTSSGIALMEDDGIEVMGPEIHTIRYEGYTDLVCGRSIT
ncbi:DNA repair protein RAD51 homolog 2 isoform X2 [Aristolochia californica]|uniref:DNA repair protein RAD51 homolog 2 isoform X2 n=1 Tax=Aristolochia californica TaxID=171875 RepID=UPI0035D92971